MVLSLLRTWEKRIKNDPSFNTVKKMRYPCRFFNIGQVYFKKFKKKMPFHNINFLGKNLFREIEKTGQGYRSFNRIILRFLLQYYIHQNLNSRCFRKK